MLFILKVVRRSVMKLLRASDIQDGCPPVSFLLDWCTAAEMPISIKLRLLQLLSSVEDKVCQIPVTSTAATTTAILLISDEVSLTF